MTRGEVILTGTVDSRHAKRRIEDLLEDISGIKELNNQIRVNKSGARLLRDGPPPRTARRSIDPAA